MVEKMTGQATASSCIYAFWMQKVCVRVIGKPNGTKRKKTPVKMGFNWKALKQTSDPIIKFIKALSIEMKHDETPGNSRIDTGAFPKVGQASRFSEKVRSLASGSLVSEGWCWIVSEPSLRKCEWKIYYYDYVILYWTLLNNIFGYISYILFMFLIEFWRHKKVSDWKFHSLFLEIPICINSRHWMRTRGPGQKSSTLCRDCCGVSLKALFLIPGRH